MRLAPAERPGFCRFGPRYCGPRRPHGYAWRLAALMLFPANPGFHRNCGAGRAAGRQETMMSATSKPVPSSDAEALFSAPLSQVDPQINDAINKELGRQRDEIELIASENIVSRAVLEAQGSVLTNKYAEGLPGKRYYGGCQFVDIAETLAIERVTKLFGCAVRQCAAAFRRLGQCRSILRAAHARRHLHGAQSRRRRTSVARHGAQHVGQMVQAGALRRAPRRPAHRHGRSRAPRQGAQAKTHHRRRLGLSAHHRLPPFPRNLRRSRRAV